MKQKKKKEKYIIINIIIIAIAIFIISIISLFKYFASSDRIPTTNELENTTWTTLHNESTIKFANGRFAWYSNKNTPKEPDNTLTYGNSNDSFYYTGTYKFYRRENAYKFAYKNVKELEGDTKIALNLQLSKIYNKDNFFVIFIQYDQPENDWTKPNEMWYGEYRNYLYDQKIPTTEMDFYSDKDPSSTIKKISN